MALTRGTKIASKTKAEHLFGPERFRVEQTAKTSNPSLSSKRAPPKHSTHRNRHTVQVRRLLVGFARSVLVGVPLVVRERVLEVSVQELALDEELLECDLKELARARPCAARRRPSLRYALRECMQHRGRWRTGR